jgi:hypothetical protein
MTAILVTNPIQAANRIESLGLNNSLLLEVIDSMALARRNCTDNDPPGSPGWSAYRDGTRRLREVFATLGWDRDDFNQIACIAHKKRGLRVSVISGDAATGDPDKFASNVTQKGAATHMIVSANQMSFMDSLDVDMNIVRLSSVQNQPGVIVHWYLFVYCDGDEVRAELSCPVKCSDGYFTDFEERIFISREDGGNFAPKKKTTIPTDGSEFDIPVVRKMA